ncbi:hypothetical protein OC842_005969 [Tilletia horrida]|uniref:Prenylcysteine lyase domain-containing protein n=1 Tax=Tilletia horrida TaxID=155126 RepID=A0AAN6JIH2_9BASI|nr:hypothetical protein OC842_005969 [Tilletia horrida]
MRTTSRALAVAHAVRMFAQLLILALLFLSVSAQIEQQQQYQEQRQQHAFDLNASAAAKPKRVAIIGGGASGSSAAFFLSRAHRNIEITLFEKEARLGGRSTTVTAYSSDNDTAAQGDAPNLPPEYAPIELGASIFVSANRNMARAAKLFGLNTTQGGIGLDDDDSGVGTSIWDGQQFVYEGLDGSWWNSARMIWRYGYSPLTMRNLISDLVGTFTTLYDPIFLHRPKTNPSKGQKQYPTISGFPWRSIETLARKLKFDDLTGQTAEAWFTTKGVGKLFIEEIIEAATRVNYGQTTNLMHALGAGVSLAASNARAVKGGNWQVFDQFAKRSGATVLTGIEGEVTGLVKFQGGWSEAIKQGWISTAEAEEQGKEQDPPKWYLATRGGKGYLYDAVILGAPFHSTGIAILNSPAATSVPPQQYVHLHVTLLITSAPRPRAEPFGRGGDDKIARSVLTTASGFRKGGKMPDFNSLSYLRRLPRLQQSLDTSTSNSSSFHHVRPPLAANASGIRPEDDTSSDFLVKIFSPNQMPDERLQELFGKETIKWVYRKQWDAYPVLDPTREFPPVELDEGLYYVNSLEPMISTMETSTVSARNVVALLLEKWYGSDLLHGGDKCPWRTSETEDGDDADGKQRISTSWLGRKKRKHPKRPDYVWDEDETDEAWSGWGCRSG